LNVTIPSAATAERLNLTQYLSGLGGRTTIGYPPLIILFCWTVKGSLGSKVLAVKSAFTGTQVELPRPEPSTIPENLNVSEFPVEVSSNRPKVDQALPFHNWPWRFAGAVKPTPTWNSQWSIFFLEPI